MQFDKIAELADAGCESIAERLDLADVQAYLLSTMSLVKELAIRCHELEEQLIVGLKPEDIQIETLTER